MLVPLREIRPESCLQERGGHGKPACAAETAEEVPVGDDDRAVRLCAVRLEGDHGWLERAADADACDADDDGDDARVGVAVEEEGEACGSGWIIIKNSIGGGRFCG